MWCPDKSINLNELQLKTHKISVEFYQKRYHNFPVKQTGELIYTLFNEAFLETPPVESEKKVETA